MKPRTLNWTAIDHVLLDMDGTLLDLHFDTHFWTEHLPRRLAVIRNISRQEAEALLFPRMRALEGTMDWYCLDFWSAELGFDVALLKEEVQHLIAVHPHVTDFLDAVRRSGRRAVLVTNAHNRSLELKLRRTAIGRHLDAVLCAHDFGLPKEDPRFWARLQRREPFDPARSLLVDDSPPVLRSAERFGIAQLRAVLRPDSRKPARPRCRLSCYR